MSLKITKALNVYYESSKRALDEFSLQGFLKRVQEYPETAVLAAIEEARFSGKFPDAVVPLEILRSKTAGPQPEIKAREQWVIFLEQLQFHHSPEFADPVTAYLAKSVFPILQLKQTCKESELPFLEQRFIRAYTDAISDPGTIQHIELKQAETRALQGQVDGFKLGDGQ